MLCDTNGGTLPDEVEAIVGEVAKTIPGDQLGIHAHNDTGQAVANSLAAVRAGARQIQGTLNGIGERCGNANLTSLIPTLLLKPAYADRFEIGVTARGARGAHRRSSHRFDELVNRAPNRQAPYVGATAFTTKAGIHASAIAKDPKTYEHVAPETVGNRRHVLVSDQAGKSNLIAELARIGIEVDKADRRLDRLLREVKEREARGYAYEGADARSSCWRGASSARCRISSTSRASTSRSSGATTRSASWSSVSEAVVKIDGRRRAADVGGRGQRPGQRARPGAAQGPRRLPRRIADLELVDFKVRILNGGTGAVTRVLIELSDGSRRLVVHGRRLGEHRRCLVRGAERLDRLQADAVGDEGGSVKVSRGPTLPRPAFSATGGGAAGAAGQRCHVLARFLGGKRCGRLIT